MTTPESSLVTLLYDPFEEDRLLQEELCRWPVAPPPICATQLPRCHGKPHEAEPGDCFVYLACATSGPDPERHDLLEVAFVHAHTRTFDVLEEATIQIVPERLPEADAAAIAACGYNPRAWGEARPLGEALTHLVPWLEHLTVAGHHAFADYSFLLAAYRRAGVHPPRPPRHLFDTASLGWPRYKQGLLNALSLDKLGEWLGFPGALPRRALDKARHGFFLASALSEGGEIAALADMLPPEEREMAEADLIRRVAGPLRSTSGPVRVQDSFSDSADELQTTRAVIAHAERAQRERKRESRRKHSVARAARRS
jgi:DNA polymerase III subunit epsilon